MPIKSYAILDPIPADPRFLALKSKMHVDGAAADLVPG
jgi:hypothetical protein